MSKFLKKIVMAGLDPAISGAPLDPRVKPAGDGLL